MAVYLYNKYKILLKSDSHKTQGLQTGDIVRRQYVNGTSVIYSLMCVLSYGIEKTAAGDQPYFIGALLDGDVPKTGEILDFVRITNLFNVDRAGALYLTASDSEAPFMDIIDQIGKKASLSWPENIEADNFTDATRQYIVSGKSDFTLTYTPSSQDNHRLLTVRRKTKAAKGFVGLTQQFYQFVQNPQRVLISYKVRASRPLKAEASLSYVDNMKVDASWTENISTSWEYKFQVVTVEYSGRHLRTFKLSMADMNVNDQLYISDFNIILLSSVANFADASTMRIGKLDGIVDPVFGNLEGYGAYLQKLYATSGAHISGTLTAGDENGFGGTFYAGKIHRNCFRNSVDIDFVGDITIDNGHIHNPTGIGNVYSTGAACTMRVQSREWLDKHIGERYCYSVWIYAKQVCQIGIQQNNQQVGTIQVQQDNIHKWYRIQTYFDLLKPKSDKDDMLLSLLISYGDSTYIEVSSDETNPDERIVYLSAPQLEKGDKATQYQATDSQLNYTDDYGAWFARGGIGGTIQNPLLQLNYDGEGSIGTRTKSIELKQDGSGHLAQENIKWDKDGKVSFGKKVVLEWNNLTPEAQDSMTYRQVTITGEDTFTILQGKDIASSESSPAAITLSLKEVGLNSTSSMRQWYVKRHGEFVAIENGNGTTLTLTPDSEYWNGESSVTFKIAITYNENNIYTDEFTVKKQYIQGYEVRLTSSNGQNFHNGTVQTTVTANVYFQGKPVDMNYVLERFNLVWKRYSKSDRERELELEATIGPANVLTVNHQLSASETYRCEMVELDSFDYTFPIIFD